MRKISIKVRDSIVRMGRKKRGRKRDNPDSDTDGMLPSISSEAVRGVSAIFLLALAGFLVLAYFNVGGALGEFLYEWFSWGLGVGYMLLPLSLVLAGIAILRSFEKHFGFVQAASVLVFLLATLGMVNVAFPGRGGVLGASIATPIVSAVDTVAAVIFLIAFTLASLVIAFDVHLGALFTWLRERIFARESLEDEEDIDASIIGLPTEQASDENEDDAEEGEEGAAEEKAREEKISKPLLGGILGKPAPEPFPILTASGHTYIPPPVSLLSKNKGKPEVGDVKANMNILKRTLANFGIQVEMDEVSIGPTVTRYAMKPAEGVRLSKIVALQSNLELALAASPVRIEAPIPGKSLVGVEVPNIARTTLGLAPLLAEADFAHSEKPLLVTLGRSITGAAHYADLSRMPHLLIAGTTGAGKSVAIHNFILSLLYRSGPDRLRLILVDPKRVELTLYNSIPHLLSPVITDAKKAILAMKWLTKEMERRYNVLETEHVRDISSYHTNIVAPAIEKGGEDPLPEPMPYIVLVIDELADIMSTYPRELEAGIVRLAQMSRAVGIHLVLSTQRPSVKVITGLIKANIPARVALQVASQIDSRTILDMGGAEKLLGSGDMLFLSGEMSKPRRIQASYISEAEVKRVVLHIARGSAGELNDEVDFAAVGRAEANGGGTDAIFASMTNDGEEDDELYGSAKQTVIEAGKASTSYLQRKLGVGYARAARLMDLLEERGVIGPADGAKPREIIGEGNADELAREPEEGADEESQEKS